MREQSDERLMKAYSRGDMAAFEVLYERHRAPLYRYLLRLSGNAATANDLYQGSWEKVIKARKKYSGKAPFQPWLYRVAHNHAMDHFRRSKPVTDDVPEDLPGKEAGPEDELASDSRKRRLARAIQDLPDDQRDTVLLKLEGGLDLQTIAQITGVNAETAKSRLRYAVKKLKLILAESDSAPDGPS